MKTRTFFNQQSIQLTTSSKCESTFITSGLRFLSEWRCCLIHVEKRLRNLRLKYAIQVLRTGLTASLLTPLRQIIHNKKHLLGVVLLVVGIGSVFVHQLFFDMYVEPHDVCRAIRFPESQCFNRATGEGWCYASWFYYYETIRFCIAAILLTISGFLLTPIKKSVSVILFSTIQGAAWVGLLHYTFSVESHETYHMFPHWHFAVYGLCMGVGVIIAADYLAYWWNHKALGNWTKFVGVAEMKDVTPEQKEPIYQRLAKDFREIQKTI